MNRKPTVIVVCCQALLVVFAMSIDVSAQGFRRYQRPAHLYRGPVINGPVSNTPAPAVNHNHSGKHWSQSFDFGQRDHDFGTVATASKQEHVFEFRNTLQHPIHLTGVRASCGCTKPTILTPTVPPGEMARVKAKYDTLSHRGKKSATVTVNIRRDLPTTQYGEVQFSVRGMIRQDVVLQPGQIQFDNVSASSDHQRKVNLKYAGNWQWKLRDVRSTNPNLKVEFVETERDQYRRRVGYELTVTLLNDQPAGTFTDQLILETSDSQGHKMPIEVFGRVRPAIETSPVKLGAVEQHATIKKKLILKSVEPFLIQSVDTTDARIKVGDADGNRKVHLLTYELDTSSIGLVEGEIVVKTNLIDGGETRIPFQAQVVSTAIAGGN